MLGRGSGGQVVSLLAFYSDDLSSNTAEVNNFSGKLNLKTMKINKKRPGLDHFYQKVVFTSSLSFSYAWNAFVKYTKAAATIAPWFCLRYHPAAPGLNPKHTIYAFLIYIFEIVMRKERK